MELTETTFEDLLVTAYYLIVTYRAGKPCGYQVYTGQMIGSNREYFMDGKDFDGNNLTHKFFLLPQAVR